MKNILIDCTTLSKKIDGLTQYTMSIVLELLKNTPDKYIIICRYNEVPDNFISQLSTFSEKLNIEYLNISTIGPKRDFQFAIWFKKNLHRFDIFYEPSAQFPLGIKGGVYTIHDILYERFPEKLGKLAFFKKIYLHHVVKRGLNKSDMVIAVSNYTKSEICRFHGEKYKSKIKVIYEGYEHLKNIRIDSDKLFYEQFKNLNNKYFLYIGSSRGHKNLYNLFLAYERANVDWNLVIIGRMDRLDAKEKRIVERINNGIQRIIFTGWINDNQMYTILSKANAFVFPSKSEGFGIPILESWYFRIPLLCSDIPVFNEIAEDACIKFNPFDIIDIAKILKSFITRNEQQNNDLIEKQLKKLQQYSWKDAADQIYNCFVCINSTL